MSNTPESAFSPLTGPREHRIKFDSTISLGHVLTFVSLIAAGFGAYNGVVKRVTVLEEQRRSDSDRSSEIDRRMKDTLNEMRGDFKEMQRSINELNRTLTSPRKGAP